MADDERRAGPRSDDEILDPRRLRTRGELGTALARLRTRSGLTLRDLARRVSERADNPIGASALGDWCRGRRLPQPSRAGAFVSLLGVLGVQDTSAWAQALVRLRSADARRQERPPPGPAGSTVPRDVAPPWAPALRLPADTVHFRGRGRELAAVAAALDAGAGAVPPGTSRACVVHGMAGVGKTAVAIRAARRLAPRFPDGCLFVDLRGHTLAVPAVSPAEALDRLLRWLGVAGEQLPGHVDDRAALWRERLAGRRILVVLDDARSAHQVRPLLPAEPGCAVLVTSRNRLAALDEARSVRLGPLPTSTARSLLRAVVGRARLPADAGATDRVVGACGNLPLAIRIAGARLRDDPRSTLGALADGLADDRERLRELDDGERSLVATLAGSYESLPMDERWSFGLLARHPGPEVDGYSAAALLGLRRPDAVRRLERLTDRHLLVRRPRQRYCFHDLVGAVARHHVLPEIDDGDAREALRRLVDFCLAVAERADTFVTPHRYRVDLDLAAPPVDVPDLQDYDGALRWLVAEEDNLVRVCLAAGEARFDRPCWQLAYTLRGYLFLTKRWAPWRATHEAALVAARRAADRRGEAMTTYNLGLMAIEQERYDEAAARYRRAAQIFRTVGDLHGERTTLASLAWVDFHEGRYAAFLREARRAHAFYVRTGSPRDAAITLRGIGQAEVEVGQVADALAHLQEALAMFTALRLRLDAAMTLNILGEAHAKVDDMDAARLRHIEALDAATACGSVFERARASRRLGDLAWASGDRRSAQRHWEEALEGYRSLGAPQGATASAGLAALVGRDPSPPDGSSPTQQSGTSQSVELS